MPEIINTFDRWLGRIIRLLALIVLGVMLGYAWHIFQEQASPVKPYPNREAFRSEAEQKEFNRLLRKHGLQREVSIIYEDHLGQYFIRKNQRCAFN